MSRSKIPVALVVGLFGITLTSVAPRTYAGGDAPTAKGTTATATHIGTLNFGGNWMDPPYSIEYRNRKPIANGYGLAPEPSLTITPAIGEGAALCQASALHSAVESEARKNGWDTARMLAEWRARALKIPSIASADVAGDQISFRTTNGLTLVEMLKSNRPHEPVDPDSLDAQDAGMVKQALNAGALVFILPDAILTFPLADVPAMWTAARKVQRSASLTPKETRALEPVLKYLRNPLQLIPVK